jgi:hypothetical protein
MTADRLPKSDIHYYGSHHVSTAVHRRQTGAKSQVSYEIHRISMFIIVYKFSMKYALYLRSRLKQVASAVAHQINEHYLKKEGVSNDALWITKPLTE